MEITASARVDQPLFDFDPETIENVVDQVGEALLKINPNGAVSADLETGALEIELVVWSNSLVEGFVIAKQQIYEAMIAGGITWHFDESVEEVPSADEFAWSVERTDTKHADLTPA